MPPKRTPAVLPSAERSLEELLRDTQKQCFELHAENDKLREMTESLEYRFGRALKRQKVPITEEMVDALEGRPRMHTVTDLKDLLAPVKGGEQMK